MPDRYGEGTEALARPPGKADRRLWISVAVAALAGLERFDALRVQRVNVRSNATVPIAPAKPHATEPSAPPPSLNRRLCGQHNGYGDPDHTYPNPDDSQDAVFAATPVLLGRADALPERSNQLG
jgi:hypothetical protein